MAGAQAGFDYANWIAQYPEFGPSPGQDVPQAIAQGYFDLAGIYWLNDGTGPVTSQAIQTQLMYMLTAHLAQLFYVAPGAQPNQTVGRVSNATEGSVTVALEYQQPPGTAQWFAQTKYGAQFWAATGAYRTMRYYPGCPRQFNPPFGGWSGLGNVWPNS